MATLIPPPTSIDPMLQQIGQWVTGSYPAFVASAKQIAGFLVGISIVLSIFFFIGIIYTVEGLKKIRDKEDEMHDLKVEPAFEPGAGDTLMAHRWDNALKNVESPNENDWKQAIIDCDIILDDLLTKMGYQGETIGEKLKRVAL